MVSSKTKLHMATSMQDLIDKAALNISKSISKDSKKLVYYINKLNDKLRTSLMEDKQDEELIYFITFRIMILWEALQRTDDYISDNKYFKLLVGKYIHNAITVMEAMDSSLKERYRIEYKKTFKTDKRTEIRHLEDTECSRVSNKAADVIQVEEAVTITCKELRERLLGNDNMLIIDTRPPQDFNNSKISKGEIINIPSNIIKRGESAAMLREQLLSEKDKNIWKYRDDFEQIVLLDWNTEKENLAPGCKLLLLKNIFLIWDPGVTYKNKPLILDGGYERWLDTYPIITTNAKPRRPQDNDISPFVPLDEIMYPMADLADSIIPIKPAVSTKFDTPSAGTSSDGGHFFTPTPLKPEIDRSKKPEQSKPAATVLAVESGSDISSLSQTPFNDRESITEMTGDSISTKPTADKQPTTKKPEQVAPATVTNKGQHWGGTGTQHYKNRLNSGDGDSDDSSGILGSDKKYAPSFSSGLKRSRSSPNIAQLKDDVDVIRKTKPQIDRSSKPSPRPSFADSFSPRSHGNVSKGLTGLKNLGNLCYMNSIMQCVSNTEELKKQLISFNTQFKINRHSKTRGLVFDAVKQLIFLLHQGAYRWVTCKDLKNVVGQFRDAFAGYEQQDSHEFLTELMDWLHEDLNCPTSNFSLQGACEETGEKAWGEFKRTNESIVLELFYGQLRSTITCSECHKQSVTFDPFSNLSLPLPANKDRCKLSECITLYLAGESISGWNCPRCKEPRKATKKFDITRLPPVLVLHLKRFMAEGMGTGWLSKRPNLVDFPLEDLDMRQYAANSEQRYHTYNLYAVSNHYGTMDSGHYTAYCKNYGLNKWYKYDDQEVAELSPSEVRTPAAYILFYSAVSRS